MRDRLTGPMAIGIVLLITVPFAFWGIDSYLHEGGGGAVAKVGGVEISQAQLQNAYNQSIARLQNMLGDQFKPDMVNTDRFKRGVLENLIRQQLIYQQVNADGYQVTDAELRSVIAAEPAFQKDGQFSDERYQQVLAASGMRSDAYEAQLRHELKTNQLEGSLRVSAFVTRAQMQTRWALLHQQRHIAWLQLDPASLASQVSITDKQVADRYERDKANYHTDERVKLRYVELDRKELKPASKPSADVLRVIYDSEKDSRFIRPEQRRARHILIKVPKGTTDPKAKHTIEMLAAKLKQGADFAKLAEQYSQDPGSSKKGGELGWVSRGVMVPAFEQALFALKHKGDISAPVRSDYGWHLIQLEDLRPKQVKAFDDPAVQAELLSQYQAKELNERYQQMSKRLDEISFDQPDSLKPLQDKLNLPVQTSDWMTRTQGSGIASSDAVRQAAFSDVVLKNKENSSPIKLSSGAQVVVRIADHEPARQKPLTEVAGQIRAQLQSEALDQLVAQQAQAALTQLHKDPGQAASLAAQDKGQWHDFQWLERRNPAEAKPGSAVVAQAILDAAFALPHPDKGAAEVAVAELGGGTRAVVLMDQVKQVGPAQQDVEQLQKIRSQAEAQVSAREFAAYQQYLRGEIGVKINDKALQQQP